MQITLSVNDAFYDLFIPFDCDLPAFVARFIEANHLSPDCLPMIVQVVSSTISSLTEAKPTSKKANLLAKINQELRKSENANSLNVDSPNVDRLNADRLNADSLKIKSPNCDYSSQQIYEEWKKKEKSKSHLACKEKSPLKVKTAATDFYEKGREFEEQHKRQCALEYKKLYPFQIDAHKTLNQREKSCLHQRLYGESKQRQQKCLLNIRRCAESDEKTVDRVKRKVEARNRQVDEALSALLKEKKIGSLSKIVLNEKKHMREVVFL